MCQCKVFRNHYYARKYIIDVMWRWFIFALTFIFVSNFSYLFVIDLSPDELAEIKQVL